MNIALYPEGCTVPEMGRLLDDYLTGDLKDSELMAFEEHYFRCGACLEAIRLRQSGPKAIHQWNLPVKGRSNRRRWLAIFVALALGAVVYAVCRNGFPILSGRSLPPSLAELSRATAPAYVASTATDRDDDARRRFVEAMRQYTTAAPGRAIAGLEASWKLDPSRAETGFYLGAADLVTNRVDRAIEVLRATAALGESPYLDRSKLFLAKAYVRREAIEDARRELREVVLRGGLLGGEAEQLLQGLDHAVSGPDDPGAPASR